MDKHDINKDLYQKVYNEEVGKIIQDNKVVLE